jgi:hypothetical protein
LKKHQVQKYIRSFGVLKPKRAATHAGIELAVVAILIVTVLWGWQSVGRIAAASHENPEQQRALALAGRQINFLQSARGLAAGDDCFDMAGTARTGSEPGAPCSFDSTGKKSGCLATMKPYCYTVHIAARATSPGTDTETILVGYGITVRWNAADGKQHKVTLPYQLTQSNWNYSGEKLSTEERILLPQSDGPVGGGTRILAINKLEDIPGGPAVSVASVPCATSVCAGTGYKLASSFKLTTNIPDKLITSCTWDFGDGSVPQTLTATSTGCLYGQTISHDYRSAWQLQNLPPYPAACVAPTGEALDSQIFMVAVTLHTTQGRDVSVAPALRLILPGC